MNKAKLINKIRKEISRVKKEKEQMKLWISERREEIKSYSKKLSEMIEVNEGIDYCINNFNELSDIDKGHYYSKKIYWYNKNDEKISFFEGRKFTSQELNNAKRFINEEISGYKYQIQNLADILNNEIEKLFLLEQYFYLMTYTSDYLVMGEKAVFINNSQGYIYSWFIEYSGHYYLHPPEKIKTDHTVKYSLEQVLHFLESTYLTDLNSNIHSWPSKVYNIEDNIINNNISDVQLDGGVVDENKHTEQLKDISEIDEIVNDANRVQIVNSEFNNSEDILPANKPIIYVEGKTDVLYLKKAFELLDNKMLELIEIRSIGTETKDGSRDSGCTNLNKFLEANRNKCDLLKCKVLLLYDSDVNRKDEQYDNKLFVRSLPKQTDRKITVGIENMFPDELISLEYFEERYEDRGHKKTTISTLNKLKCCEAICRRNSIAAFKEFIIPLNNIKEALFPEFK